MALINFNIENEDRVAVLSAIEKLQEIPTTWYMSRAQLVGLSGIKDGRLRPTLQDLVDRQLVAQYTVADNPKRPRYLYQVTEAGHKLLEEAARRNTTA